MKYDNDRMLKVARIVIRLNKYLDGMTPERLVDRMVGMAEKELGSLDRNVYVACEGYTLSSFNHPNGGRGVHPSVSDILFDD
jgi:hypothetical protein